MHSLGLSTGAALIKRLPCLVFGISKTLRLRQKPVKNTMLNTKKVFPTQGNGKYYLSPPKSCKGDVSSDELQYKLCWQVVTCVRTDGCIGRPKAFLSLTCRVALTSSSVIMACIITRSMPFMTSSTS